MKPSEILLLGGALLLLGTTLGTVAALAMAVAWRKLMKKFYNWRGL
jgi:hypothetical protein